MTTLMEARIQALDVALLNHIESQTSMGDKRSLLALHGACRDVFGSFAYLEIGSHLGGSLQSFIADPRCDAIVSIDPRPVVVPDERWEAGCEYPDNSTERMLRLLKRVPDADLAKLGTIESTTDQIDTAEISAAPRLCFIDGEHTVPATLRDADFCRSVLRSPGVIAFHDSSIVAPAIGRFLRRSGGFGYSLRDNVFAVEFGGRKIFNHPLIREVSSYRCGWRWAARLGVADWVIGELGRFRADRRAQWSR